MPNKVRKTFTIQASSFDFVQKFQDETHMPMSRIVDYAIIKLQEYMKGQPKKDNFTIDMWRKTGK